MRTLLGELGEPEIDEHTAWLFVPARQVMGPGEQVYAEMRRLTDGKLALLAYTSLPSLVEACGARQSWVSFPADWLPRLEQDCGFDTVVLNPPLPLELRTRPEESYWPGRPADWDG
jgi:hypothetical protein